MTNKHRCLHRACEEMGRINETAPGPATNKSDPVYGSFLLLLYDKYMNKHDRDSRFSTLYALIIGFFVAFCIGLVIVYILRDNILHIVF